jgi:hypothetical protein
MHDFKVEPHFFKILFYYLRFEVAFFFFFQTTRFKTTTPNGPLEIAIYLDEKNKIKGRREGILYLDIEK